MSNNADSTFFSDHFADDDIMSDDASERAVSIANTKVKQGDDTIGWGNRYFSRGFPRWDNVCVDCVFGIYQDAGIPTPGTSSVDEMMMAFEGEEVQLWGNSSPKVWEGHEAYTTISDPEMLKPGDILVVQSRSATNYTGKHATIVTDVSGGSDDTNFFAGATTGVTVVHDKGSKEKVSSNQYEWAELIYGESGVNEGNRKFIAAYRYIGVK